jgi:ethanolamine ammonia-lyase large subunit
LDGLIAHARQRTGPYALYFETGQGADFTNGHGLGCDMVIHESRKYGLARGLMVEVAQARGLADRSQAWVHVNDVAGFIGPEVFRTRQQLVRCCLEDLVMGKLHGLTIGLDVCSTLHMDVSLADLDWCLDQIAPAAPAYLMALPTKIDPMLGYLTTGYQDHVRLRSRCGYRINDPMQTFFQQLGVLDADGQPGEHFGDPTWVYLQYCRRRGDVRPTAEIVQEGLQQMAAVRARGLFLAEGHGAQPWDLAPELSEQIDAIYADAKRSIWELWDREFVESIPGVLPLQTRSADRHDYILHPASGESLDELSLAMIEQLRASQQGRCDVQMVVSEGLNALALMDPGQLLPLIDRLRSGCQQLGWQVADEVLVLTSGRVRAGYQIGQRLLGGLSGDRTVLHIIGERPGSGHHTLSVYITRAHGAKWATGVDHDITRVVSGIATTALDPLLGGAEVMKILARS